MNVNRQSGTLKNPASGFDALVQGLTIKPGHFDEMRGALNPPMHTPLCDPWAQFAATLPLDADTDLARRNTSLARQVRDNGITYNVYADSNGPQRPWSLDLFPLLISPENWQHIEAGVRQRAVLLEHLMSDIYGQQQLVHQGALPAALVHGNPGYLRAMHGVKPVGGRFLHLAAFDLARGPDGLWWLVGQRTQAPSGLGYLLENRLIVSGQFGTAFDALRVQRLAGTYQCLIESLRAQSPMGTDAHLALLTPGPYNETYFEHAYLARYLGLTLVEGSDLMVRDSKVFLKTLKGLVPVHGLLKRVDDQFLDPLELRADSTLGIPGLLQAIRAGNVLVANAPGSAVLESPALLSFLPALSRQLFNEELILPALPTWWCGEHSVMEEALSNLSRCAIKPTYQGAQNQAGFEAMLGTQQDPSSLQSWAQRIRSNPQAHTLQAYLPLSQMPTWRAHPNGNGALEARSLMLRVFAVSDGLADWKVLPGGLARVANAKQELIGMQTGGSSADVWVLGQGEIDRSTLQQPHLTPESLVQRKRMVTSRAAENLFWLGRYTERTENALRLARLTLEGLHGDEQDCQALMQWLGQMAKVNTLVMPEVPSPQQSAQVFERALIESLGSTEGATSVGFYLRALKHAASNVRERLSQEHWRIITHNEESLFSQWRTLCQQGRCSTQQAQQLLKDTSDQMAAITGAQTDRMLRDDGWRLLSIGRHIERLGFMARSLTMALDCGSLATNGGFDAMVALFDSDITFHTQYQQSREMVALMDLLVLDQDNPRSLSWVTKSLRNRLAKLAGSPDHASSPLSRLVPDPNTWDLMQLCEPTGWGFAPGLPFANEPLQMQGPYANFRQLLAACTDAAHRVSNDISATYFTHSERLERSVGSL